MAVVILPWLSTLRMTWLLLSAMYRLPALGGRGEAVVASVASVAVASDGADGAGVVDFADAVVAHVGDIEVALLINHWLLGRCRHESLDSLCQRWWR